MSLVTQAPATLDDLYRVESKAELIDGRIVYLMATGYQPSRTAFRITRDLDDHAQATGEGVAFADNTGFAVPRLSSGRQSFSPDASYFLGPVPSNKMRFPQGPPIFAVEVRSEGDYGNRAERAMADKRADYFEAGTAVVWDVDIAGAVIRKYQAEAPDRPIVFSRGQEADAEPAVPGWRMAVDRVLG